MFHRTLRLLCPFKSFHGQLRRRFSKCIFFPGQGAQSVGMCKRLLNKPTVVQLFEKSREILGYDLLRLCLNGPVDELNKTKNCQPAIVVASLAALQELIRAKDTKVIFFRQKSKLCHNWKTGCLTFLGLKSQYKVSFWQNNQ